MNLLATGYSSYVSTGRVLVLFPFRRYLPLRRLRDEAKKKGLLVDVTGRHAAKTLIVLDTGHIVASAVRGETLRKRLESC